ncbi:hypothetical protein SRABI44_02919 [Microbacterium foliorum]|nr:hypothetical protein SRABI03_02540 [Microbacterium foliorum]CAH0241410.1 hypothetical protein SRABI44_02919 [Microbacterium foliorum]
MQARQVSEVKESDRDVCPVYRVDFWATPGPGFAWNLDSWLLDGCPDVLQAVSWAVSRAEGRPFQLLVSFDANADGDSMILLLGENPNETPSGGRSDWGFTASDRTT